MFAQRRASPSAFDTPNISSIHSLRASFVMEAGGNRRTHATDFAVVLDGEVGGGTRSALLAAGVAVLSHQALENRW
ncbi:hypothetical protein [Nocardia amamiensis]|uniref:hypothetical protein n=1 Tax=Nocardia amamiensis TaxID=404578 RepID=UPI0012F4793C|nr:hypothetical protein [Nocardia amamiensis]